MKPSLAQRILNSKKPFTLYHTYSVTKKSVQQAIDGNKSMDLDISIDSKGEPYLGHTEEYYKISGETQPECMPFDEAISLIAKAHIPVIVDCKHHDGWPAVEDVVDKIGPHRCLVHAFISELKFTHDLSCDHDYPTEWSLVSRLASLKDRFPNVTTTASCKFLPANLLVSAQHSGLLEKIGNILVENRVDTLCLNVPDETISDGVLEFFLAKGIIPHVGVDHVDVSRLSKVYVGETDVLEKASSCKLLNY